MRNKCIFSSGIFLGFVFSLPAALGCLVVSALFLGVCSATAAQTILVPEGSTWKYHIGTNEPSPLNIPAWRDRDFNDASWSSGNAPIGYSNADPKTGHEATIATPITPTGIGVTLYFRKTFTLADLSNISALNWSVWVDDGAVVSINGIEVGRINAPQGELTYNRACLTAGEELILSGTFTNLGDLVVGNNVMTIHALNSPTASSDFFAEATLSAVEDTEPPTVVDIAPPPGSTNRSLTSIEIVFSEPVNGVDASDLLINGVPATGIEFGVPGQFVFLFPQPAAGTVTVGWASNHGITDMAPTPRPFVAGPDWTYVVDPNLPLTDLVLNEFLASNNNGLRDENGDASDWIEIYNPGSDTVSLGGWFLTDLAANLTKWRFPNGAVIAGNSYLVIFASNKNRTNVPGRLHTNFQLAQGGEYLALVGPQTNVVSEFYPTYPSQQTDVSYGRDAGDINLAGFFTTPTPGARNQNRGAGFAPEVTFSRNSGTFIMGSPFSLTLGLATPSSNAVIRYAFGTNVPGPTSNLYSGPIQVTNTLMIRARAFAPGLLPGPVTTKMYVGLANTTNVVNFNSHLPIVIVHNYGRGAYPADKLAERETIIQTFEPGAGPSSMTNQPSLAEFGIAHLRGSSTIGYQKSSFFLEIQDEFRDGKPVELLGLPREADWILYAPNNFDSSQFHNQLAHQLARDQGEYASRTRVVELYLKDDTTVGPITATDYNGIYVLEEKIKRDPNRVDVARLEHENTTMPDISGGYILSIDRGNPGEIVLSAGGASLNWIYPQGYDMTNSIRTNQINYIRNYLNNFNTTLNNNSLWTNPVTGYAAYIDVNSWLRRHVHEVVTHNIDALRLSGFFYKNRNKKIEYGPAWDYDRTQGSDDGRDFNPRTWRSNLPDLGTDYFNFSPWWGRLFNAPDFWQGWIDKYDELRGGPLSMANVSKRIDEEAALIRPAFARELVRWPGHAPRSGTVTLDGYPFIFGTNGYENEVRWKHHWYSNRMDFIDTQLLARPNLSLPGGLVSTGFSLTISPGSKPGSSVIYTLDGTDPRASGGTLKPGPGVFSNNVPVTITVSTNVRVFARSWHPTHANLTGANRPPISSRWSPPAVASYYTHLPALRITEIMYHPQSAPSGPYGDEEFEYIELRNISGNSLNIRDYKLKGGVDFVFPNMTLNAGERVLVVHNRAAFQQRYGTGHLIAGEYTNIVSLIDGTRGTNSLDNAGERLVLEGRLGEPILDFEYDDQWYPSTDGFGFSLVIVNDQADPTTWGLKPSWRASGELDGSPGQPGTQPVIPPVVINEVLTHSDPAPPSDTIELLNLSGTPANIGGWFLTDDFRTPKKYRILDGTMVPANGFLLFDEGHFNAGPNAFSLSSPLGEEVYLFSGDGTNLTGYAHGFDFGAAANGVTFGRYINSVGSEQFPPQRSRTLGVANAGPLVGPVVISEIMYHPPDFRSGPTLINNLIDEYIELHNSAEESWPLYDTASPTNTWSLNDAVDFTFPVGVSIPAGGYIVVAGIDPADATQLNAFRARNGISPSVAVYGPFSGNLDNGGEALELRRPDRPEPPGPPNFGLVPSLLVERIRYADLPPWPVAADGVGPSLQRANVLAYGNDPNNWVAAGRTPGGAFGGGAAPTITEQPTDQTALAGGSATFSVAGAGTGLTYQWRFNGDILSGATSSTLTIVNVHPNHQGNYDVVVMNPSGAVVSSNAFLTVLIPVVITAHPNNTAVFLGSTNEADFGQTTNNAVFSVTAASNRPISYQWFKNGVAIPGATTSVLTVSNVNLSHRGFYDCVVADSVSSERSRAAELRVAVIPFVGRPPQPIIALVGEAITFSVEHGGSTPFGYRWRRGGQEVVPFTAGRRSYTIENVTTNHSGNYSVVITNLGNSSPGVLSPNTTLGQPAANLHVYTDIDMDGAGDAWELRFGFSTNSADGLLDSDGDGVKNFEEFRANTNPTNALSYFRVDLSGGGPATLTLMAMATNTYVVEYRDALGAGTWQKLADVLARTTNRVVTIIDPDAVPSRYYRLYTPMPQN